MPVIQSPDMGLNAVKPVNMLDPREAAKGTENVIYESGTIRLPDGFSKLDLSATPLSYAGDSTSNPVDRVLHVFPYTENNGQDHIIAVTNEKIFDHDYVNSTWNNKTQADFTMQSDIDHPISYAAYAHNDTTVYFDDLTTRGASYYHLLVSDGGLTNIQRWTGDDETDFANLLGGGDYHDGTTHRAHQISQFKSRLLLISPREYNSSSKLWIEENTRVRWSVAGKMEDWSGTGSGFVDLRDTGGVNVWGAQLGGQFIIYQTRGIWTLNHVGGSTVFSPLAAIPDLGLLGPHLLAVKNNVHYFVGSDYHVYAYYGGTVRQNIGDKIHQFLEDDLNKDRDGRCWMTVDATGHYLWIFIVTTGNTHITKAYGMDMRTNAWTVRDYSTKWTTSNTGITVATVIGGQNYVVGTTYQEAINTVSLYGAADVTTVASKGDVTLRYGDMLWRSDITAPVICWSTDMSALTGVNTVDASDFDWSTGGLNFTFCSVIEPTHIILGDDTDYSNAIMAVDACGDGTNVAIGTHYYTLTDVSINIDGADYSTKVWLQPRGDASSGIAAAYDDTDVQLAGGDELMIFDPSYETYRQASRNIETHESLALGDADGFVYRVSSDTTSDDGNAIICRHLTPVFDMGEPDSYKRWQGIAVVAKGTTMTVRYRTSDFDTSETGWTDFSVDLTDDYESYTYYHNVTSRRIQYAFTDWTDDDDFRLREYRILDAEVQGNR